jgi:hypothetical protein
MLTAPLKGFGHKMAVSGLFLLLSITQNACSDSAAQTQLSVNPEVETTSRGNYDAYLGSSGFERVTALTLGEQKNIVYKGQPAKGSAVLEREHGLALPDGQGSILIIPGQKAPELNPDYVDARELKLKMRELAAQLVAELPRSLSPYIALPTAFVAQDDFERSSSLGRFVVEQMLYEFNQRGLSTKELRMNGKLTMREDGEFILSRQNSVTDLDPKALYLTGTYYTDQSTIFINARLMMASGKIIRTGQIIMPLNPLTRRMLANSGKRIITESIEILDFEQEARPAQTRTAFDQGLDIH